MFNEFFELAQKHADKEGTILLYSGGAYDCSNDSYLFFDPLDEIRIKITDDDPWDTLKKVLDLQGQNSDPEWVGYFGYEMGAFADPGIKLPYSPSLIPDVHFYRHRHCIHYNHHTDEITEILRNQPVGSYINPTQEGVRQEYFLDYNHAFSQAKEAIAAGEVYQINLSHQISLKDYTNPYQIFLKLSKSNPAPFSAYMNMGKHHIISSSPERLLSKRKKKLETRPIKGTAARGQTLEEDQKKRLQLLKSEKDKAELLMITDLMRNDLTRVSVPGTAKVTKLRKCEAYENVFHTLSVIESIAKQDLHPIEIIRACFPGGSVTGCPKLRAIEFIHAIEKRPRGIYTGSIGYFSLNGDFDFNIAIRTMFIQDGKIDIQLGGAIVADSQVLREYKETLNKGSSMLKILRDI